MSSSSPQSLNCHRFQPPDAEPPDRLAEDRAKREAKQADLNRFFNKVRADEKELIDRLTRLLPPEPDRLAALEKRVADTVRALGLLRATTEENVRTLEAKLAEVEKRVEEISSDQRREAKRLNALEAKAAPETQPERGVWSRVASLLRHAAAAELLPCCKTALTRLALVVEQDIPPASVAPAQEEKPILWTPTEGEPAYRERTQAERSEAERAVKNAPPKRDDGPGERCARDGCGHSSRLHNPNCVGFHTWPDGGKNPVCQCHCHTFVPPAPEPPAPTPIETTAATAWSRIADQASGLLKRLDKLDPPPAPTPSEPLASFQDWLDSVHREPLWEEPHKFTHMKAIDYCQRAFDAGIAAVAPRLAQAEKDRAALERVEKLVKKADDLHGTNADGFWISVEALRRALAAEPKEAEL